MVIEIILGFLLAITGALLAIIVHAIVAGVLTSFSDKLFVLAALLAFGSGICFIVETISAEMDILSVLPISFGAMSLVVGVFLLQIYREVSR